MRKITYAAPSGTMTDEIGADRGLRFNETLDAWVIVYDEEDEDEPNDVRTKIIPDHRVFKVDIPYHADSVTN